MKKYVCLSLILFTSNLFAWGNLGHQMVGKIGQLGLTPASKAKLEKLFGPGFDLGKEATFADEVRENRVFDPFKPWHFAESKSNSFEDFVGEKFPSEGEMTPKEKEALPFLRQFQASNTLMLADKAKKGDAISALNAMEQILISPKSTKEQLIFAVRYIVHIMGDIHQPLHAGFGSDFGANSCLVKWMGKENQDYESGPVKVYPVNLHSVWDNSILKEKTCGTTNPCDPLDYAKLILNGNPKLMNDRASWQRGGYIDWAQESADIRPNVYPVVKDSSGNPVVAPGKIAGRPYCKSPTPFTPPGQPRPPEEVIPSEIKPDLNSDYLKQWQPVVEERILKAGIRLGKVLNEVLSRQ